MRALFLLPLFFAPPAAAMLSPWYDSAEKIMAILQSAEVADAVRQAPIGAVSNIGAAESGNDLWQVRVQDCDLTVELVPAPCPRGWWARSATPPGPSALASRQRPGPVPQAHP